MVNLPRGSWLLTPGYSAVSEIILVSAVGTLGTQQRPQAAHPWWVGVHVAEPVNNFYPHRHGHFVHESIG